MGVLVVGVYIGCATYSIVATLLYRRVSNTTVVVIEACYGTVVDVSRASV